MKKKIKLLLSAAGGAGTIEIINVLKATGRYWTAAVDADRYAVGMYLADHGQTVPLVADKKYFAILGALVDKFKIDVYIPLIDEELLPAYDFADQKGIKLVLPEKEFSRLVLNKYEMVKSFKKKGISCPETSLAAGIKEYDFNKKMIIKPVKGRGSRGVVSVDSEKAYREYFAAQKYRPDEVIVQEFIEGEEYTVSAVVGSKGRVYAIVPKRIIKKAGITYLSVTERNPLIEKTVDQIIDHYRPNGPFNVQLKIYKGKAYILEVNPRFSTTVAQTIAAGVNEVNLLVNDFLGLRTPKTVPFQENLMMVRYLKQFYIKEDRLK